MSHIPFQTKRGFKGFLNVHDGLKLNNGNLTINNGSGIATDNNGKLTVDNGTGLVFDNNGKLENEWYNMQPPSDLNMNSNKITNLGSPAQPQDATSKTYVDSLAGTPALKDSLRTYYSFDNTVNDLTTNGYDGNATGTTFNNSTTLINQSLEFTSNSDKVNVGNAFSFQSNDFTVSLWVYPNSTNGSRTSVIGPEGGYTSDNIWAIEYGYNGNNLFRFFTKNGSGDDVQTPANFPTGQWYHVVIIRTSGTGQIWINGQKQAESSVNSGDIGSTGLDTFFGSDNKFTFDGIIDECGAWSRVLRGNTPSL